MAHQAPGGGQRQDKTHLVLQLVQHSLSRAGLRDEGLRQAALPLFSYVIRLLGSNLSHDNVLDEQAVIQGLKLDLQQRLGTDVASRLLDAHSRLCADGTLQTRTRAALLALLARLAKDGPQRHGIEASASLLLPTATGPVLGSTGLPALFPDQGRAQHADAGQRPADALPFSGASPDRPSANGSKPGATRLSASGAAMDLGSTLTVSEPLLVRDVLFACQGISGRLTVFQEAGAAVHGARGGRDVAGPRPDQGGFAVVPEAQVPPVERMLVARLTELGWLYRRVQAHLGPAGGAASAGAIRQALHGAFQVELGDFYRLMAVLEAHAAQPIPLPGEDDGGCMYLTLRRLVVWLGEPTRRMRLMAVIADGTAGKQGGALVGAVHALAHHGDPFVASFGQKVLHAVCMPLFAMIRRWVFEGALEDPHKEFFVHAAPWVGSLAAGGGGGKLLTSEVAALARGVGAGPGGAGSRDLWRSSYWVEPRQVPPFISPALASKILRAGKSINYLQAVCGDSQWAQEAVGAAAAAAVAQASDPGALDALERAVDTAAALVDARVLEVLTSTHCLFKHCEALRRYLLLGQGDFVTALMELVSKELDQEAGNVSEMQLNHALRTAVASSVSKYDEEDVVERLRARKDRAAAGGEAGWDVFTLHYDMPGPLTTVFTPTAMSQYLRVFQLLWRLKRAEFTLAATWTTLQCAVHRTLSRLEAPGVAEAGEVARRCLRLRADMSHFTTNLQYYLMFEVLEAAWQEFSRKASAASDLDTLIAAHEAYLDTLMRKALLDEGSQALRATLNDMTRDMLGLHGMVQNLNEVVQGAERRTAAKARRVALRTAAGQWGTVQGDDSVPDGISSQDLRALASRLADLERAHAWGLQTFTKQLPAQAHDEVRFLLYRLDFNDFNARALRASELGARP